MQKKKVQLKETILYCVWISYCIKKQVFLIVLNCIHFLGSCPANMQEFDNNCFNFVDKTTSWAEAEAECKEQSWQGMQGHLASIHSKEENDFVARLANFQRVWIGGTDVESEGNWSWSDGSAMSYTGWCPGNPNNQGGAEHCMDITTCLNDNSCNRLLKFVCKFTSGNWILES